LKLLGQRFLLWRPRPTPNNLSIVVKHNLDSHERAGPHKRIPRCRLIDWLVANGVIYFNRRTTENLLQVFERHAALNSPSILFGDVVLGSDPEGYKASHCDVGGQS